MKIFFFFIGGVFCMSLKRISKPCVEKEKNKMNYENFAVNEAYQCGLVHMLGLTVALA